MAVRQVLSDEYFEIFNLVNKHKYVRNYVEKRCKRILKMETEAYRDKLAKDTEEEIEDRKQKLKKYMDKLDDIKSGCEEYKQAILKAIHKMLDAEADRITNEPESEYDSEGYCYY